MNFFETTCQEPSLNHDLFGLCDDQNGDKAYTNINDPAKWTAIVKNDNRRDLIFIAIDKCVIKDNEEAGRGRCDGMLTSSEHLFFIELKDEKKGWITGAIEQLESTIQFFIANHDISIYKHKKAYACNKRHRHFQEIDNELKKQFFRTYKVRLDVQGKIIVV